MNVEFVISASNYSFLRERGGFCTGAFSVSAVKYHHIAMVTTTSAAAKGEENFNGSFRMALPPPNVTGNLHAGRALTVTVEDTFCRYHKFLGKDVVWYPGFDHAGIATQTIVEKKLFRDTGKYRRDVSDSEFLQYCEMWKNDRMREISNQLNLLGADLDWPKLFYTMDENFSSVVTTAFCKFYEDDLIFRDKRLVNWCPVLESTISDQEVELIDGKKICLRSGAEVVQIEKEQWFLRCDQLHDTVMKALRNGEVGNSAEILQILQKQLNAALARMDKLDKIGAAAAKTRDEKLALNSHKPFVVRHIQKMLKVVGNSARKTGNSKFLHFFDVAFLPLENVEGGSGRRR